jgi:RNA polymerase sigma-70 factor (ECF subfamily)
LLREKSDEELMIAYQLGEAAAFEALYSRHAPKVLGFLRKKLKNESAARDVFQSTFLKLHKSRHRYDASLPFLPWLFTICRSELLDALKKPHLRKETSVPETPCAAASTEPDRPEIALTSLSPSQRHAIELRYGCELSFDEIANRLETSPANARKLVSRALQYLRGIHGKR